MDDVTLRSLKGALARTPDNLELLAVVLQAQLDRGEAAEAAALLSTSPARIEGDGACELAARVLLAAGQPEAALRHTRAEPASLAILHARALLGAGRAEEARTCYAAAVAANPTLESPELRAELHAREVIPIGEGRPRLRVIANDDTAALDAERLLGAPEAPVKFADVGGLHEVKKEIERRIVLPFQKPSLFQKFRKRVGGGILLYGPPGCGKTLLARATAGECNARFYNVAISDILDMYIGESERKLHALFEKARSTTPAVMFFDELEGLAAKRQYGRESNAAKLVSQFLTELDGFAQNNKGVLIMGATNVPWAIDPAFRRPGRFDRTLFVPPPDKDAREAILQLQLAGRPQAAIDHGALARATQSFSGADLGNLIETAADAAIEESLARGTEMPISMAHCKTALEQVKPTCLEWLTTARNYARYANEAGQYDEVLEFLKRFGK